MKNAVITGPTGAVGTALVNKLIQEDIGVTALVNPQSRRADALPQSPLVNVVKCGLNDYAGLAKQPDKEYNIFYHLAWQGTVGADRNNVTVQSQNCDAAVEAVRLAHRLGCRRFVFAGSQAEYGVVPYGVKLKGDTPCNPVTEYGKNKLLAGERTRELCRELGMEHIWVRILSVYGPGDGENSLISAALRELKNGKSLKYTAGEQIWDYLYSEDAARALYLFGYKGVSGRIYPLGSGEARPLSEYIRIMHSVVAPNIEPRLGEVEYQPNQVMYLTADISQLKADTGFVPLVSFIEGLSKLKDSWMCDEKD